jgi:hypothetical protein
MEDISQNKLSKRKIKGFRTIVPPKSAFTIETSEDFPKLHSLCIASGKRGGGKSVAIANFIKRCKDAGYYDRVWIVTPTYWSNKHIWDIAEIEEEDVFEPTMSVLKEVVSMVEAEREEWDSYLLQKEMYKDFKKEIKRKRITDIDPEMLIEYQDLGFFDGPPQWKYKNEVPPRLGLILDDTLGTPLMAKPSAGLVNLCIKHRHIGKGLGISIFMLVQSYCSQGGINRAIRENTTLLLLFKVNQETQIKKIIEESDLPVSNEKFFEMCKYCHDQQYNFLLMDFVPKDETKRFRSGWSEYLM